MKINLNLIRTALHLSGIILIGIEYFWHICSIALLNYIEFTCGIYQEEFDSF